MEGRIGYTQRNLFFGVLSQILKIILSFLSRTMFIKILGREYLGLNGLFADILSMMSLTELGIGGAITFSLYEPLAKRNSKKLQALMKLYKNLYFIIGIVIAVLGLLLLPFLDRLVNFDSNIQINYYMIFLFFLFDSVSSYFFSAYRSSILQASQQEYIITNVTSIFDWLTVFLQLGILIIVKNYYAYLVVKIVLGILKNKYIAYVAGKKFPFLNEFHQEKIDEYEKRKLIKNVYALSLTKISAKIYSSVDNIIISAVLGTILVGYYSNYYMIIYAITSIIGIIIGSAKASVGNLNVLETAEHKFIVFKRILFINFWGYSLASVCMLQLISSFIKLWIGEEFVLENGVVLIIIMNFLISGLHHTVIMFKDACGLHWQLRYCVLVNAILNLVASIIFAHWMELAGVFLGTIVSYLVTVFPCFPYVLYKEIFKCSVFHFYKWYTKSIVLSAGMFIIVHCLCTFVQITGWGTFIIQTVLCFVLTNLLLIWCTFNSKEFKFYFNFIQSIVNRCFLKKK